MVNKGWIVLCTEEYYQQNITSIISPGIISQEIIFQGIKSQYNNIAGVIGIVDIFSEMLCKKFTY